MNRHLMCGLIVCLVAAGQSRAQEGEQQERVLRIVPVGVPSTGAEPPAAVTIPPFIGPFDRELRRLIVDHRREVDPDWIADLVRAQFEEKVDEESLTIEAGTRHLRIRGGPADVEAAADWLRSVHAAVLERVRIDAWLVPVEEGTIADGTAAVFEADAPVSEKLATWHGSAVVPAGNLVVLHDTTRTPIVIDIDANVSQGVTASTPHVGMVREGVAVGLILHPLAGSPDVVVSGQLSLAAPRRGLRAEPTLPGMPSIEVPELNDHVNTFSARVPDGGGCVVWHGGDPREGGREALVVRVSRIAADAAPPSDLTVIPIGGLSQNPLRRHHGVELWADPGTHFFGAEEDALPPQLDVDQIVSLVYEALGAAVDEPGVSIESVDEHVLLVRGPAAVRKAAREMVRRLEDELLVNASVLLRTATDDGRLLHEVAFPALLGRTYFAFRGTETIDIVSYGSKMAAAAEMLDPQVMDRYSGLVAVLVPVQGTDGVDVDARVDLVLLEEVRRRTLEGEAGGALSLVPTRHATYLHSGPVTRQEPIQFGAGRALDGARVRQTLEIR